MERWSGRVALVTGGSEGIGRAIALNLARSGLKVVICARNEQKLQEVVEEGKKTGAHGELFPVRCDLGNVEEILAMFTKIKTKYGGVDVCINNAACFIPASLLTGPVDDWSSMLNVNLRALSLCTRESINSMKERGVDDGQIIHISSMAGHIVAPPNLLFYSATKHAVRALTTGLKMELRATNSHIRISSVSPGYVATDKVLAFVKNADQILKVEDVANAVAYILSTPPHVQIQDILIYGVEDDL